MITFLIEGERETTAEKFIPKINMKGKINIVHWRME